MFRRTKVCSGRARRIRRHAGDRRRAGVRRSRRSSASRSPARRSSASTSRRRCRSPSSRSTTSPSRASRRPSRRWRASPPTSRTSAPAQAIGGTTGGKSEADLRGLSGPTGTNANKTLVLLNGRRLANHAFDAAAVDLNAIPLAAIDRIEVLRDGASAIYGTDAIGGVINFILKREYSGLEISAQTQQAAAQAAVATPAASACPAATARWPSRTLQRLRQRSTGASRRRWRRRTASSRRPASSAATSRAAPAAPPSRAT